MFSFFHFSFIFLHKKISGRGERFCVLIGEKKVKFIKKEKRNSYGFGINLLFGICTFWFGVEITVVGVVGIAGVAVTLTFDIGVAAAITLTFDVLTFDIGMGSASVHDLENILEKEEMMIGSINR